MVEASVVDVRARLSRDEGTVPPGPRGRRARAAVSFADNGHTRDCAGRKQKL